MAPRPPGPDVDNATPSANDIKNMKTRAAKGDKARDQAYKLGAAHAAAGQPAAPPPEMANDPELEQLYLQGHSEQTDREAAGDEDSSGDQKSGAAGRAPVAATRAGKSGLAGKLNADSGAGLVLGMIAYALAINYLRGGLPAVKGWFGAKFLNKAYQGPLQAKSYQTPPQPSQPIPNVPVGPPVGVPSVLQSQAGT